MQLSNIPTRFSKVWAVSAAGAYIRTVPVDSQIGIQDGAASFTDGFVPDNFTPVSAGGVPPFGQDFNGLLNVMTAWQQWNQAGGPVSYNSTFSTAVSGYPLGAVLNSSVVLGAQWYSTVDGNTTNPDDPLTSSGWTRVGLPAGAPQEFLGAVPTGFVAMRGDQTIGSAASGATTAADNTIFLYIANWSNSQLSIFTSAGGASTRGANAIADFNANKRLQMPDGRGASMIGVDVGSSTYLNGVPVVAGNTTTPGSTFGENLHTLIIAELAVHDHGVYLKDNQHSHSITPQTFRGVSTSGSATAIMGFGQGTDGSYPLGPTGTSSSNITIGSVNGVANDNKTASVGSGTAHNTVQRSLGVNWGQKL